VTADSLRCPACATELPPEPGTEGLCPRCLLSLALPRAPVRAIPGLETEEFPVRETEDGRPAAGQVLGERYQLRELLGRGGMGEVWRAFDLKLRVDVALKAILPEYASNERFLELLRREVRSAREVVSPNVCRIFDLVVEGGQELVSMEYVDGTTLADTLRVRGPLALSEAREVASQLLAGLEAIHQAGFVHRDLKPENVMTTRAGRVVIMDFGLAKGMTEGASVVSAGTPAYMSPEQAFGEAIDSRADVFSAGVVLAEMLAVGGENASHMRRELWKGLRDLPPQVPDGPWASVLRQALATDRTARYDSARSLARALEEVTFRIPGFEQERPYPGLSSFTEKEAEYFFGRELELEAVWKKLERPRLLALIGPSGAGKSSFLRAGLLPALPKGWSSVLCTLGNRPLQALARALVPVFSGDLEAIEGLLRFEEADAVVSLLSRWRRKHAQNLLVIDQFEELFTQNPKEVQESFAKLIGRLVVESDVTVLVSLRDDFLIQCQGHDALAPLFTDLTPLGTLSEASLRRALVQPALACGYRFEAEPLVDEMIEAVSRERGALPLLAFAASRLWENRDREKGLLTRGAYEEIGGVAGALAQHAETTLERIGTKRTPIVRELFRNLFTAQGTRAARGRSELLSVFGGDTPERAHAAEVLDALVGARLLTSYECPGDEGLPSRQEVEVIHESLLTHWPRLVRWQTQDADGAQLRDQLRQAAQAWNDRGRPTDLLWSGTAYRELSLWRERYAGGLTATEREFADAAARLAGRRRQRRRLAVAAALASLATAVGVTGTLWKRAETSRHNAEAQALHAEASKLLALGQTQLDNYPTAAVAYALKSLELADTVEARLFALRAVQRGPTATLTPVLSKASGAIAPPAFSPDGEWLAQGGWRRVELFRRGGGAGVTVGGDYAGDRALSTAFGAKSDVLLTSRDGDFRIWSLPDGRELRPRRAYEQGPSWLGVGGDRVLSVTRVGRRLVVRQSSIDSGSSGLIGSLETEGDWTLSGGSLAYARGRSIFIRSLDHWESPPRLLAEHRAVVRSLNFSPDGQRLVAADGSGQAHIWPATAPASRPLRTLPIKDVGALFLDPTGRWLAGIGSEADRSLCRLWDLQAPSDAEPIDLRRADATFWTGLAFEPSGRWIATSNSVDTTLWSIDGAHPHVFKGHQRLVYSLAFTPDGTRIVSTSLDSTLRSWPLTTRGDGEARILLRGDGFFPSLAVDPASQAVVLLEGMGRLSVVPLAGGTTRKFDGLYSVEGLGGSIALEGRLAAVAPIVGPLEDRLIRIVDLETGTVRRLPPVPGALVRTEQQWSWLQFLGPDRLLASVLGTGLVLYDLRRDQGEIHSAQPQWQFVVPAEGRYGVGVTNFPEFTAAGEPGELVRFRIHGGTPETLPSHGRQVSAVALSPSGTLVATGGVDGTVRIGPVSGEEPFVFYGHEGIVWTMAFSPDGRWVASGGNDGTVRLWPVPDTSAPPPQSWDLPRLLAMLRARTNLRAELDPQSAAGWKIGRGPFPGWARLPEW
jgi:WD40 repeat protein